MTQTQQSWTMPRTKCVDCYGSGKLAGVQVVSKHDRPEQVKPPTCDRCQGSGRMFDAMRVWIKVGQALRSKREAAGLGLREAAVVHKMQPSFLSDLERGMIFNLGVQVAYTAPTKEA